MLITDNTAYYEALGYHFFEGHTFKHYVTTLTWTNAKTACEILGGHLATSTSAEKNLFLTTITQARTWLGATDEETEGTWKWVTGEAWSYTNWGSPQPDNAGGTEHYLEINSPSVGSWNDWINTPSLGFLCEWDFDLRRLTEIEAINFLYDNNYHFYNGHTFKYISTTNTWLNAKSICEAVGGHLATSTSAEKNNFLQGLANIPVWLGGTDEAEEGRWQWITGEEWSYTNWSVGEPNNQGDEHYLELLTTGLWNDYGATPILGYLCEWDFDVRSFLLRNHEGANNLLGGSVSEHYHLTGEELNKLQEVLTWFTKYREAERVINHEEAINLMGGILNEHYHLTAEELNKLKKVLDLLFPNGTEEPQIPYAIDEPVAPYTHSGDLFGGLPSVTPPEWTSLKLPNYSKRVEYSCYDAVHSMYYGMSGGKKNTTPKEGLHVLLEYGSNSNCCLVFTKDLNTWTKKRTFSKKNEAGKGISQYMYINTGNTSNTYQHRLYIMLPGRTSTSNMIRFLYNEQKSGACSEYYLSQANVGSKKPYVACCYSDKLKMYIFVSEDGHIARVDASAPQNHKVLAKEKDNNCGIAVNPSCVAWSSYANVFCVTGEQGTATSIDAKGAWAINTNAPKKLVDLVYREDLPGSQTKGFFARSAEDNCFYASADGQVWEKVSTAPIPLNEIAAVDYNPDLGWYCAIGGKSQYAFFSKDLVHWVKTKVSNLPIDMGSVIWMPSTQKYVLMPKSGSMYYTFAPADWIE